MSLRFGGTPSTSGRAGGRYIIDKFVHGLLRGPRDAAQQHLLNLGIGEIGVGVSLHPDERARGLTTRERVFVSPDLRRNLTLVFARAGCWRDNRRREHV